jgi:lysophospholipase L1-like esterase
MKKIIVFAAVLLFALPSMGQAAYNYRSRSLYEILPVESRNIVFLGDSITDECEWAELFGNYNILNRGISADRALWLSDRLDPIVNGHPKKLFLMIGTNDLSAGSSIDDIVGAVEAVVNRFQKESPDTELYIQSVLPVDMTRERYAKAQDRNEKITELNNRYKALCTEDGITYIDLNTAMADETGNLRADLSNDGLHLMGEGYTVWKQLIASHVK